MPFWSERDLNIKSASTNVEYFCELWLLDLTLFSGIYFFYYMSIEFCIVGNFSFLFFEAASHYVA
jgi:hypothetical protein